MITTRNLLGGLATIAALALCAVPSALAAHGGNGGGGVRVAGTCTANSSAKLKLKHEDSRIEVEVEVDQNRAGVTWKVVLKHNGAVARRLTKVTRAPSGSFTAGMLTANAAGADRFVVTATRAGETCTARASI